MEQEGKSKRSIRMISNVHRYVMIFFNMVKLKCRRVDCGCYHLFQSLPIMNGWTMIRFVNVNNLVDEMHWKRRSFFQHGIVFLWIGYVGSSSKTVLSIKNNWRSSWPHMTYLFMKRAMQFNVSVISRCGYPDRIHARSDGPLLTNNIPVWNILPCQY